jgi:hypothetical protein
MSLPTMTELYNIGRSLFRNTTPYTPKVSDNILLSPNNETVEIPLSPTSTPLDSPVSLIHSNIITKTKEKFTQYTVNKQKLEGRLFRPSSDQTNKENIFERMFDGDISQSQIQKKRQKEKYGEKKEFKLGSITNSSLWQKRHQFR